MEVQELRSIATKSLYLRGLNQVPIGLLLAYWGVLGMVGSLRENTGWSFLLLFVLPLGLLQIASRRILRFYEQTFGRVSYFSPAGLRNSLSAVPLAAGALCGLYLNGQTDSWSGSAAHLNPLLVLLGLGWLVSCWIRDILDRHHLAAWGSLIALGLFPVWGRGGFTNIGVDWLSFILYGVTMVVTGWFDHRSLVHLAPPDWEERSDSGAS